MRTLQQWFDEYAVSHQNETNITIHYICVPAIFFSIVGIIMSIPSGPLQNLLGLENPLIENWGYPDSSILFTVLFTTIFLHVFKDAYFFSNMHYW